MIDASLIEAVTSAIESAVSPIEVDHVSVVEGETYDSEPVLYITVDLPAGTGPLPGLSYMEMLSSVNGILIRSGEERTPLFRTVREGEEEPLESTAVAGS